MTSLSDFAESQSVLEELRETNARLARQLGKQKVKTSELVEAVYRAAKDAASGLKIPSVVAPLPQVSKKTAEVAVAVLSDFQLAKVTPSYSTAACERRVIEYAEKVAALADIQRADHPVRELRVYLLGDIIEGELIFPGQAHLIDASLYRQVTVDGPRILCGFLRRMLTVFEKVKVVGVIGNHGSLGGRARKDYHPESNADAMLYKIVKDLLADEKRLDFVEPSTPGERHWYATDTIGSKTFFMFHGDQIKGGFAGWPWYGFGKKLLAWKNMYGFDYSLSGHFHNPVRFQVGNGTHWGNGSTESENTYAAEMLAAQGRPSQWLLFTHPKHGVTAEYEVHLR